MSKSELTEDLQKQLQEYKKQLSTLDIDNHKVLKDINNINLQISKLNILNNSLTEFIANNEEKIEEITKMNIDKKYTKHIEKINSILKKNLADKDKIVYYLEKLYSRLQELKSQLETIEMEKSNLSNIIDTLSPKNTELSSKLTRKLNRRSLMGKLTCTGSGCGGKGKIIKTKKYKLKIKKNKTINKKNKKFIKKSKKYRIKRKI